MRLTASLGLTVEASRGAVQRRRVRAGACPAFRTCAGAGRVSKGLADITKRCVRRPHSDFYSYSPCRIPCPEATNPESVLMKEKLEPFTLTRKLKSAVWPVDITMVSLPEQLEFTV